MGAQCPWRDVVRPLAYGAYHDDMLRSLLGDALEDKNPNVMSAQEWKQWLNTYPEKLAGFFPPVLHIVDALLALRGLPKID